MGKKKIGEIQTVPTILKDLSDIRCCDGDSATFECQFSATPPPDIRWERSGKLIHLGGDFNADFDGETARLSISQVYPEDEGEYTCVAYNELGKAVTSACLIVDLVDLQVLQDEDLTTLVKTDPSQTVPGMLEELCVSSHAKFFCGVYKIILENDVGRVETSAKLDVIGHRVPSSRGIRARSLSPRTAPIYPRNIISGSARLGSRARLYCDIRATPMPNLRWFKDGALLEDSDKYCNSYDGSVAAIEIETVSMNDAGLYTCIAENENGCAETHAFLEVYEEDPVPPEILKSLDKNIVAVEGNPVTLRVEAIGTPPFDVVWMKDGCILPDCQDFRQGVSNDGIFTLALPDAYPQDSGDYRCEIYNSCGDSFSTCHLTVLEKDMDIPQIEFLKHPSPVMIAEGGNASFCVRVRGSDEEQPIIQWEVAGQPVVPSEKFRVEEDGDVSILHIVGVTRADAGPVKCFAGRGGQSAIVDCFESTYVASCDAELTIHDRSDSCSDSGASMEEREEMEDVEEAAAMLLRGPQDTTALVGDRVLLKATYLGHPEPSVRWTRAGRELKNDERTSITSGNGVSCLLLQNITADDSGKYDVCVKNVYGADCNYASVSVEGPPDPPSGKPCISASQDNVTVAWSSSPYDGGKIVNGYALEYSMVGSDIWTVLADECHSLSYVVRGLQPGGRYVFRVRAFNVHGYSRPSLESDVVILEEHDESISFEPRMVSVEPGPEFKSRYDVFEEIGKGRFGVVHKVIEKETNQKLAAKFIKCRSSKDKDKVQDEIDIMNLLRHQKLLQLAAAFEHPREMIMIMEYISGGELFERVVADDFTLTEKDCILFMRQICEGVAYMHSQNVVHLDLKPENIMCHTRTSHEIKIIDFGLAQKIDPKEPVRVLFGTPEFIPPEIISYEPIGVESDMWSLGVICYVLLSGLSPFMGDNDSETFANITRADYDFEDEAFNTVSQNARDFIGALLVKRKEDRLSAEQCLKHVWLDPETHQETVVLCTDKLKKFIIRRKWQKTGNAIRALGRMATLSASRRNSANSTPNTPRTSLSGTLIPRMSSLNEEDSPNNSISNGATKVELDEICKNIESFSTVETSPEEIEETYTPHRPVTDIKNGTSKSITTRACTERSDSGISDCSTLLTTGSCTSTPLLSKKFRINEEVEYSNEDKVFNTSATLFLGNKNNLENNSNGLGNSGKRINDNIEQRTETESTDKYRNGYGQSEEHMEEDGQIYKTSVENFHLKSVSNLKLSEKIESFSNASIKSKPPSASDGLKRLPIYISRTVAGTIKKFDTPDKSTYSMRKTIDQQNKTMSNTILRDSCNDGNHDKGSSVESVTTKECEPVSRVEKIVEKFSSNEKLSDDVLSSASTTIRYRSPSPSVLRKTHALIAKGQCNDEYMLKAGMDSSQLSPKLAPKFGSINITSPKSPLVNRKDKPKSESFQKAAAFWNSPKT
nr:myosin light chain kinase, smooth muscle-like [Leptinotarsa decemlineata]